MKVVLKLISRQSETEFLLYDVVGYRDILGKLGYNEGSEVEFETDAEFVSKVTEVESLTVSLDSAKQ